MAGNGRPAVSQSLPEQRAHILGGFVEPRLALTKGEPSLIPWGELREQNYLLVSGAPGSGKTTLLRHWLLWHADRTRRGDATVLPLCVSLRHFTSSDTMESSLRREAVEMGAPWLGRDLRAYARRGMLAVAFDGLDEVPAEYRNLAMRSISEFTRSFPYCRYLVTTRPQVGIQLDVGLLRADLLPLDRSRCRQLAYHRLYETKSWKTFTAKVEAEPALDWVVGNPLALSLIIARFLRHEITPSYVTEIIAGVVDMFVDGWDASRGVVRTKNRNLSPAEKRKILGKFAARRKLGVSDGDATPLASEINAGYGEESLLSMLSEHTGLLTRQDRGVWAFRSSALEEYFRATVLVSALTSKAGEFRKLLKGPISAGTTYLARFISFMSSDADDQIDGLLRRTKPKELGVAAKLTDVLSQSLPTKRSTLFGYANLVVAALDDQLSNVEINRKVTLPNVFLSFTVSTVGMTPYIATALGALIAALHRSRDGVGAETILAVIESGRHPHLTAIQELLRTNGELQESRTHDSITWKVVEILPDVPAGPTEADLRSPSDTLH